MALRAELIVLNGGNAMI